MLSQTDAAIAMSRGAEPWPDPAHYPLPKPVEARVSWFKLIASGVFALVLAAMIALMLRDNALSPEAFTGWRLWLRIGAAMGIGGLGLVILYAGIKSLAQPDAVVSIDAAGLQVPALYNRRLPWSEITLALHDKPRVKIFGSGRIVLGVRDGSRFGRGSSDDLQPAAGPDGLDVAQVPQVLDVPVDRLMASIQAHRAHYGCRGAMHDPA